MKFFKKEKNVTKVKSDKTFMERATDLQNKIEAREKRLGKGKYGRVLKMARKPTNEEYSKTSKITAVGILAIGGLGFLVFLIATLLAPWILDALGF